MIAFQNLAAVSFQRAPDPAASQFHLLGQILDVKGVLLRIVAGILHPLQPLEQRPLPERLITPGPAAELPEELVLEVFRRTLAAVLVHYLCAALADASPAALAGVFGVVNPGAGLDDDVQNVPAVTAITSFQGNLFLYEFTRRGNHGIF